MGRYDILRRGVSLTVFVRATSRASRQDDRSALKRMTTSSQRVWDARAVRPAMRPLERCPVRTSPGSSSSLIWFSYAACELEFLLAAQRCRFGGSQPAYAKAEADDGAPSHGTSVNPGRYQQFQTFRHLRCKPLNSRRRILAAIGQFSASGRQVGGAGEGNRTLVFSLEGCCSTIELHPRAAHRA